MAVLRMTQGGSITYSTRW